METKTDKGVDKRIEIIQGHTTIIRAVVIAAIETIEIKMIEGIEIIEEIITEIIGETTVTIVAETIGESIAKNIASIGSIDRTEIKTSSIDRDKTIDN